jgi:two-component system cell cycle sensor histidine kinase/response regulator CckA
VEQVLLNLAANARDAMPQGGTLTIRVENERLTARRARDGEPVLPGEYVCLSVSDTGTGIDVDILDHVFEPFFTTKEVGQGTGLGLATVYGIIKQSGGHIDVESELDCGTTFRLYFPRYAEAEPEPEPPEEPKPMFRGGDETVLVVEDEEMLRRMVCTGLRANGYRVLEARNADEALQCCQEHSGNIQLLLTDVIMPGRSGSQLAALAAAEHPGIKVMFMSGYTDSAIVHHGIRSAEVHFLPKPFNLTTLMQKVREVLESA